MIKSFSKNNWQILLFNFLTIIVFILFYGRFGDSIVDSFREAYISEQIVNGLVPYKNIFVIYPPFAYLFNALLFFIFGIHLRVLYFAGLFATLGIVNLVYATAKKFLTESQALSIVLFFISASVISPNVFNTIFPYSYGALYGILFALCSIYCALNKKFPIAYLFFSLAVCSKFELAFLLPILFWYSKREKLFSNVLSLIIPPAIIFGILMIMGVGIGNVFVSAEILFKIASAKTLYWFYSISGLIFRPELLPVYAVNFVKVIIPIALIYFFRNWLSFVAASAAYYFFSTPDIFIFAFPLVFILFVIKYRSLDKDEIFIVLASLLVSAKLFFALTLKSYGVFFTPFALISFFILTPKHYRKAASLGLIVLSFMFFVKNSQSMFEKSVQIKTERGVIKTVPYYGNTLKELTNYIDTNTQKGDKAVVFPECLLPNFMTARSSDNKFYSLIPLYVEVFGDKIIINRLEITKPEYIVISNYDTSNYYYSFFGQDYAESVLAYITDKYEFQCQIGSGFTVNVFKRK